MLPWFFVQWSHQNRGLTAREGDVGSGSPCPSTFSQLSVEVSTYLTLKVGTRQTRSPSDGAGGANSLDLLVNSAQAFVSIVDYNDQIKFDQLLVGSLPICWCYCCCATAVGDELFVPLLLG